MHRPSRPSPPAPLAPYAPARARPRSRARASVGLRGLALAGAAAAALGLSSAAGGCNEVIGLGPEPTSRAAAADGVCGLPAHPNPACDACLDKQCCNLSWGCYDAGDKCAEQSQCAVDCAYDNACLDGCERRYASKVYGVLETCLLEACLDACLPSGPCARLIECCAKVPAENAAHDACVGGTNRNDAAGCQALIDSRLLNPFCPELAAPGGAGVVTRLPSAASP